MALTKNNSALIAHNYKFGPALSQRARAIVTQMNLDHMKWEQLHWEKYIIEQNLTGELSEKTFIEFFAQRGDGVESGAGFLCFGPI